MLDHRQHQEAGYTEDWNAAVAACHAKMDELQSALNAMFVIAYPALATIHHANNRDMQTFFVELYEAVGAVVARLVRGSQSTLARRARTSRTAWSRAY